MFTYELQQDIIKFGVMEIQDKKKLKRLIKSTLKETVKEEKDFFAEIIKQVLETMEDEALARAMKEGKKTRKVDKEEVFKLLGQ